MLVLLVGVGAGGLEGGDPVAALPAGRAVCFAAWDVRGWSVGDGHDKHKSLTRSGAGSSRRAGGAGRGAGTRGGPACCGRRRTVAVAWVRLFV